MSFPVLLHCLRCKHILQNRACYYWRCSAVWCHTNESQISSHLILGSGKPVASQFKNRGVDVLTVTFCGTSVNWTGTRQEERNNKIFTPQHWSAIWFKTIPFTCYKNKIITTISENEIHKLTVFSGHKIFALE